MPELPEVESIRQQLEPLIRGARIVGATAHPSLKFSLASDAVGNVVTGIDRRGKYLLVGLEAGRNSQQELIIHLGMTGGLQVDNQWRRDPYCRARWQFEDGRYLWFRDIRRFGRLVVVNRGDHRSLPTLHAMGPEPFDPELDPARFHNSLASTRKHIKTSLLSQRPVAGLGNIYADEALWRSRINPVSRRVGPERADRLLGAIRNVISEALDYGGTTLRDYRKPDGSRGHNQHRLDCYGRAGQPCPACGTTLASRIINQRSTTWCPICQAR